MLILCVCRSSELVVSELRAARRIVFVLFGHEQRFAAPHDAISAGFFTFSNADTDAHRKTHSRPHLRTLNAVVGGGGSLS